MTGALLAGGLSSRMGQPKPLLELDGQPLGLHLLSRLREFNSSVVLLTNDPVPYESWGYKLIPDIYPQRGPLAGLHAALKEAQDEWVFLLACDLPFFPAALGRLIYGRTVGHDVVIPRRGPYLEPLCAAYSKRLLPMVETKLRTATGPDLKLTGILSDCRVAYIDESDRAHLGPDELLFLNINTPADFARARELWPAWRSDAGAP